MTSWVHIGGSPGTPAFRLHIPLFILAFLLGISYVLFAHQPKKEVEYMPTPYNDDRHKFKDEVGNCFKYRAREVPCTPAAVPQRPVGA